MNCHYKRKLRDKRTPSDTQCEFRCTIDILTLDWVVIISRFSFRVTISNWKKTAFYYCRYTSLLHGPCTLHVGIFFFFLIDVRCGSTVETNLECDLQGHSADIYVQAFCRLHHRPLERMTGCGNSRCRNFSCRDRAFVGWISTLWSSMTDFQIPQELLYPELKSDMFAVLMDMY